MTALLSADGLWARVFLTWLCGAERTVCRGRRIAGDGTAPV